MAALVEIPKDHEELKLAAISLHNKVSRLQSENAELRRAVAEKDAAIAELIASLEPYAEPGNYVTTSKGFVAQYDPVLQWVMSDRGRVAAAAIKKHKRPANE